MRNPFKPTAGARPPLLIGREHSLDMFEEGLDDGSGAPGLLTVFTGPRGVGKTVMLSQAEDIARAHGWVVVSDTATPGLIGRLARGIQKHLGELGDGPKGRRITGITIAGNAIATQPPFEVKKDLRELANELTDVLDRNQTGLVITIDEIHAIDRTELSDLAAVIQHLIREGRPVSLLLAGIPRAVSDLLNEDVSTFLRRADQVELKDVPIKDVERALAEIFDNTKVTINTDQLRRAAQATGGYPFLIQLVGCHVWRLAFDNVVTDETLADGVEAAKRRLGSTVIETAISDLSAIDRTYLLKMAEDDGSSKTSVIAERMGASDKYASVYRSRLIDAGIIYAPARGLVDFGIPWLREYLRDHAASVHAALVPDQDH